MQVIKRFFEVVPLSKSLAAYNGNKNVHASDVVEHIGKSYVPSGVFQTDYRILLSYVLCNKISCKQKRTLQ
jgi:hypothetical protein